MYFLIVGRRNGTMVGLYHLIYVWYYILIFRFMFISFTRYYKIRIISYILVSFYCLISCKGMKLSIDLFLH